MNLRELGRCLDDLPFKELGRYSYEIEHHTKIIILGNGGSNAIAQHIAQDLTKVKNKKALCFADASRLTCYINDYGMDNAYSEFLKDFCDNNTLVILISSSGESKNIINAAAYCKSTGKEFIILTGFEPNNELRTRYSQDCLFEIWVDSKEYGVVELTHEAFLHSVC